MNREIASACSHYFENLKSTNELLLELCNLNSYSDDPSVFVKYVCDIATYVLRVVPYTSKGNKDESEEIKLKTNNGLLEFDNQIGYLKTDFQHIIELHGENLLDIKRLRNKYEHVAHKIEYKGSCSGSHVLPEVFFVVASKESHIKVRDIVKVIILVNKIYNKLREDITEWAKREGKEGYPYYKRLVDYQFLTYNDVFREILSYTFDS